MTDKNKKIIILISLLAGWFPAACLASVCIATIYGIVTTSLTVAPLHSFAYLLWMLCGLLGFWGLSAVSIGVKLDFRLRFLYLILGVISAMLALVLVYADVIHLPVDQLKYILIWQLYFLVSPMLVGCFHIYLHLQLLKQHRQTAAIAEVETGEEETATSK